MKANYEDRTRMFLPRRTNTIIRLDGRAFHTYTKDLVKPFDLDLIEDMNQTAEFLCREISGAKIAYVQSDEISILLTDYDNLETNAWFDGNIQKIASVSASMAAAKFNQLRAIRIAYDGNNDTDIWNSIKEVTFPSFDARVFSIPELTEVANYFLWRNQDCARNSVQMIAHAMFSNAECENKKVPELMEMIKQLSGSAFETIALEFRHGRLISKALSPNHLDSGPVWGVRTIYSVDFEGWFNRIKTSLPSSFSNV